MIISLRIEDISICVELEDLKKMLKNLSKKPFNRTQIYLMKKQPNSWLIWQKKEDSILKLGEQL